MAEAALTPTGRVRKNAGKKMGRPKAAYRKPQTKKDVTLTPTVIAQMKVAAHKRGFSLFEFQRLAVKGYMKHRILNPVEPHADNCPTCLRPFAFRRKPGEKRLRVSLNFDDACVESLAWLAENFYRGTHSRAFEDAILFFITGTDPMLAAA